MRAVLPILTALFFGAATVPGVAALSPADLGTVAAAPRAGARVPLDLPVTDLGGAPQTLGQALAGRPALLVLADYRCTQLCGSILGIAAQALAASGLRPDKDFTLAIVGFNPEAGAGDAATMRDAQLAAYPELKPRARLLLADRAAATSLEDAIGYTAVRDPGAERFAHPAELYVLTADGRISRVLSGLSLDGDSVRLALVEAGEGRIGSLVDRLHVLCYGLDPLTGASTDLAQSMLRGGASLTLAGAGGCVVLAWRRRATRRNRRA